MDGQLFWLDALLVTGLFDEVTCHGTVFIGGYGPADCHARKNVDDRIKIETFPFIGAGKFGDIPAPDLIGGSCFKNRLHVFGMLELIAAFFHRFVLPQNGIHGADAAIILTLVEQGVLDLSHCHVHKLVMR